MSKLVSTRYTANLNMPINHNRNYFGIYSEGTGTLISFDNSNAFIPIPSGFLYEPYVCPTNEIYIQGSAFTIVEGEN